MRRIPESGKTPGVKIEHFHCQKDHSDKELDYKNMLVACLGNEGSRKELHTCDTKKGDLSLSYSPSSKVRDIESLIEYKANGEIYSSDKTFNSELENVLNLNVKRLKDNRRIVYKKVQEEIRTEGKRHQNKVLRKEFLQSQRKKWANPNDGKKYIEYCMVGVYLIDKKLRKIMNSKLK